MRTILYLTLFRGETSAGEVVDTYSDSSVKTFYVCMFVSSLQRYSVQAIKLCRGRDMEIERKVKILFTYLHLDH